MIQNVECVRADLESHPFIQPNTLRQRHVQLREQWTIERTPRQRAGLTWTIVEKHFSGKRRLPKRRRSTSIGINHRRIDVVNDAVLIEDTDQVTDLRIREIGDCRLVCRSTHTVQRASRVNDGQRCTGVNAQDAAQLPTSDQSINRTTTVVQKVLTFSKRQIVNRVEIEYVGLIKIRASIVEMLILIVEERRHPCLIFAVYACIARANVVQSFLKRIVGLH